MIQLMGLYKRGNVWYGRRRVNGRLVRISRKVENREEAEAVWRLMEADRLAKRLAALDPSRVMLSQLKSQFLSEKKGFVSENSLLRYKVSLEALERELGASCLLRSITSRKLSQWTQQRLTKGGKKGEGMSPQGVNSDLRHIKAALRQAAEWGLVKEAPKIKMLRTPKQLSRHIEPDTLEKLLKSEVHPERKRLWLFLLWTGCRRAEAFELKWSDITWNPPMARGGHRQGRQGTACAPAAGRCRGPGGAQGHLPSFSRSPAQGHLYKMVAGVGRQMRPGWHPPP